MSIFIFTIYKIGNRRIIYYLLSKDIGALSITADDGTNSIQHALLNVSFPPSIPISLPPSLPNHHP